MDLFIGTETASSASIVAALPKLLEKYTSDELVYLQDEDIFITDDMTQYPSFVPLSLVISVEPSIDVHSRIKRISGILRYFTPKGHINATGYDIHNGFVRFLDGEWYISEHTDENY